MALQRGFKSAEKVTRELMAFVKAGVRYDAIDFANWHACQPGSICRSLEERSKHNDLSSHVHRRPKLI
jgi:hypothetical protein